MAKPGRYQPSAQTIYVEEYPTVVTPDVRQTVVALAPIVRERTVVVRRPAYLPARGFPLPHYGYAEERYVVTDW
jgi:hypothetical protein